MFPSSSPSSSFPFPYISRVFPSLSLPSSREQRILESSTLPALNKQWHQHKQVHNTAQHIAASTSLEHCNTQHNSSSQQSECVLPSVSVASPASTHSITDINTPSINVHPSCWLPPSIHSSQSSHTDIHTADTDSDTDSCSSTTHTVILTAVSPTDTPPPSSPSSPPSSVSDQSVDTLTCDTIDSDSEDECRHHQWPDSDTDSDEYENTCCSPQ